ncbi:acetyl-CoA carboxylase biotin carboxyl carrier protein subunit [Variovorax sp. dw_954]|uniref:acetyl-CoA carboxylase biotin carboxyl carrier protein subunit n=1 Tax=Variovorax sp. dw_954 TaxID=2720078 RepID=UPI001BD3EE99|nr:acetyl-CoA carboxylase biotin carboxyl carrier protein subunit [Variovorax sp. dw_954]
MTLLSLSDEPSTRHQVHLRHDGVAVDDTRLAVRQTGNGEFSTLVDGRIEKLLAVANGDAIYVQLQGRAWRVERIDPTRARSAGGASADGSSQAPMPGVVVSLHAAPGQLVRQGEALLVIESMKLQMTIGAACDGVVAELPFAVGQTFQRGAVLVRVAAEEGSGA